MEENLLIQGSVSQIDQTPTPKPNLVTIIIGAEGDQQMFMIHKELICYHSPVFAEAFNGESVEGEYDSETQTLVIDLVHSNVFACLVTWLYTKEVVVEETPGGDFVRFTTLRILARLWFLAQALKMPRLQDDVLEVLEVKIKKETNVACRFWVWLYALEETDGALMMRILVTFRLFLCWQEIDPVLRKRLPNGFADHIKKISQDLLAFERSEELDRKMKIMAFRVVRRECGNILSEF